MSALVCLLTDFGHKDHYVGVMKGVLLAHAPGTTIVDLTHDVPPQDIRFAAFQLLASYCYFPKATLFVCVVDPGVGSDRRLLYAEAKGWRFLAPDNGLLSWVFEREKPNTVLAISKFIKDRKSTSRTFHGRDILAPLAARLLKGEKPTGVGTPYSNWIKIPFPSVKKTGSEWIGEVLAVDGFGNLITSFLTADVEPLAQRSKIWFELGTSTIRGLSESYSAVEKGRWLAIGGSSGFIEISLREGNATQKTGLKAGDPLRLTFRT